MNIHDEILSEYERLQESGVVLPKEITEKVKEMQQDWTDTLKKSDQLVTR